MNKLERHFVYTMAIDKIKNFNELIEELYRYKDKDEFENHPYDFDLWVEQEIINFENSLDWDLEWMEKRGCCEIAFKFFKFLIERYTDLSVDIWGYI